MCFLPLLGPRHVYSGKFRPNIADIASEMVWNGDIPLEQLYLREPGPSTRRQVDFAEESSQERKSFNETFQQLESVQSAINHDHDGRLVGKRGEQSRNLKLDVRRPTFSYQVIFMSGLSKVGPGRTEERPKWSRLKDCLAK